MVDDHLQCSEELSNKDEFISRIATEKTKPTIVPDGEQEECVDNCNVKPTSKAAASSIELGILKQRLVRKFIFKI